MKKRCKRKVWALICPIKHAIDGARVTSDEDLGKLYLRELASIEALANGKGDMQSWHDMATTNNLAQTLCGMGIGRIEVLPVCKLVEDELINAARRYTATKRMGLTGPGIQHLRDLIAYHDLQRQSIPRSQYEEAIRLTAARISSGHATIDLAKTLG